MLKQIKQYQTELKKHMEDSEIWLNKSNNQAKQIKQRVIQIFMFFSEICLEKKRSTFANNEEKQQDKTPR